MASESSSTKITVVFFIVVFIALVYFLAPMFLPVYSWISVDYKKISKDYGVSESFLKKKYKFLVFYNPIDAEPNSAWQIMKCDPFWEGPEGSEDEEFLKVRISFISDRTGKPPAEIILSGAKRERFYKVTASRLPKGCLKQNSKRPVLLYDADSFEKIKFRDTEALLEIYEEYDNDDDDDWE